MKKLIEWLESFTLFLLVIVQGCLYTLQVVIAILFYGIGVAIAYVAFGVAFGAHKLKTLF